jgi:hypothetical protein
MEIAIVGPAGSGKSTLFSALTGLPADGRGEGIGVGKVPDARIDKLSEIYRPKKTTYAEVRFRDPLKASDAGMEKASPQALETMRGADLLAVVIPQFLSEDATGKEAAAIFSAVSQDLVLRDYMTLEKRTEKIAKEGKGSGEADLLRRAIALVEAGSPLHGGEWTPEEQASLRSYRLLSLKPWLAVASVSEAQIASGLDDLRTVCGSVPLLVVPAALEVEVMQLPKDEREGYFAALGVTEPALDLFIRTAYRLMDLVPFFTTGEDEVRAWTIRRGTMAPEAAGVIHSDIQRGFIRAEVISYDDFMAAGTMAEARKRGTLRLEGKTYLVADGDIINFRFNV